MRAIVRADHPVWLRSLLVAAAPATTLAVVLAQPAGTAVPWAWAPSGILAGLALATPRSRRLTTAVGAVLTTLACVVGGIAPGLAVTLGLTIVLEVAVVRGVLLHGRDSFEVCAEGDIGRLVAAVAAASGLATVCVAAYVQLDGGADVGLTALQVFLTHASSTVALLPFFLPSTRPSRLMSRTETVAQATLLLSVTTVLSVFPGLPPLYFALLPTFAWLAFRSSLRWGALMLVGVSCITTVPTLTGQGPVYAVVSLFDLPLSLVPSLLSLFLLDCALVMFPIAVVVTQQREAADSEHRERERLARVVDATTSVGILATDPAGTVTLISPGAAAMLQREQADVLGQPIGVLRAMTTSSDDGAVRERVPRGHDGDVLARLAASGAPRSWHVTRDDGDLRRISVTVMATADLDGARDGYVATLDDVTEQEAVQAAMEAALHHEQAVVARLSDLDAVKSAFVATVSHELRTPVTSINGFVEMLVDGDAGELSVDQQALVRRVSRNARRLHLLIEDLLLVSRIESRSVTIERQPVDLGGVVREVVLSTSAATEGRGLEISLPDPEQRLVIEADAAQVERLVACVVDNALKFTPDGGRVGVSMTCDGTHAEVTVTDSGVGIPLAEQAQLFTPFFRSSTSVELATQGAGMGLTIARALAEAHDGSISVSSTPGTGTAVLVRLPVRDPAGTPAAAGTPGTPGSTGTAPGAPSSRHG